MLLTAVKMFERDKLEDEKEPEISSDNINWVQGMAHTANTSIHG